MKYGILILTTAAFLAAQRIPKLPAGIGGVGTGRGTPTKAGSGAGGGGKVQTELDQAQRALDQCGKYIERGKAALCPSYHTKFDDSIADAKRALNGSGIGGAADFLSRIKEMEGRKAEQAKAIDDAASKEQAVAANLSSEDAVKDKVTIEALESFYRSFETEIKSEPNDFRVVESWPQTQKDVEALLKKYPVPKSRQNMPLEVHDMINKVRTLDHNHKSALAAVEASVKSIPAVVNQKMVWAEDEIQKGVARKDYGPVSVGVEVLEGVEKRLKVYDIVTAEHKLRNPSFTTVTREKITALNKEADKVAEQIIASNKLPANSYNGADAGQLRDAIRKQFAAQAPNVKILDIRLLTDWNRSAGYSWRSSSESWQKFDESKLYAMVLIDGGPKYAYARQAAVEKDFVNGGRMTVSLNAVKLRDGKEHPGGTFLKSNLGK
jgi:DNA-binding ferritin-like protein